MPEGFSFRVVFSDTEKSWSFNSKACDAARFREAYEAVRDAGTGRDAAGRDEAEIRHLLAVELRSRSIERSGIASTAMIRPTARCGRPDHGHARRYVTGYAGRCRATIDAIPPKPVSGPWTPAGDFAHEADDFVPVADDFVPVADGFVHVADRFVPVVEEVSPLPDGFSSRTGDFTPRTDGVSPLTDFADFTA
jgi:hypothetical protein